MSNMSEKESKLRELESLVASRPSIDIWFNLKETLNCNKESITATERELMVCIVLKMLESQSLALLWSDVFDKLGSNEFEGALSDMLNFADGFRSLINYYEDVIIGVHNEETFTMCFVDSLIAFYRKISSDLSSAFIAKIFAECSASFESAVLRAIVENNLDPQIISMFPPDASLHCLIVVWKIAVKNSQFSSLPAFLTVLQRLTSQSLSMYNVSELLNALYFKIRWNQIVGDNIERLMSNYAFLLVTSCANIRLEAACYTAMLFGDKSFMTTKGIPLNTLLAYVLIHCLKFLSAKDILSNGLEGVSISSLLSAGISHYLDVSDVASRILGMRVATSLSEVLGNKIVFEELTKLENIPSSSSSSSFLNADNADIINNVGNDSDGSDSELEPFDLELDSESGLTAELQTNYLTICLQMLRTAEDKSDAAKRHSAALTRISEIMMGDVIPYDSKDLCLPLVKELIIMTDHFQTENFEEKRKSAILALLVEHPSLTLPFVGQTILSSDTTVSLRIYCIALLRDVALTLSQNVDKDIKRTGSEVPLSVEVKSKSSYTKISHPRRLAVNNKRIKVYRNAFGNVANLIIFPLTTLLQSLAKKLNELVGVDAILPSKAFAALSVAVQSSLNTINERRFTLEALGLSILYRDCSDLELRRSFLTTSFTAMNALFKEKQMKHSPSVGVLNSLTNIANEYEEDQKGAFSLNEQELEGIMFMTEWIVNTLKNDADDQSRTIKQLILQLVEKQLHSEEE